MSSTYEEFTDRVATTDIVTVHGLFGSGEEPWTDTDARPKWLETEFFDRSEARVINFNYGGYGASDEVDNGDDSNGGLSEDFFSPREVHQVAEQLLKNIVSWRRDENEERRPLAFITKDLGGIIVKQALILASEKAKYVSILYSTFSIVFIQCPHHEIARDSIANGIVELICNNTKAVLSPGTSLIRAARLAASTAAYVNNVFLSSGILSHMRIANVFSTYSEARRSMEKSFAPSTLTIGSASEILIPTSLSPTSLLCGEEAKLIYERLWNVLEYPPRDDQDYWDDEELYGDDDTPRRIWPSRPPPGLEALLAFATSAQIPCSQVPVLSSDMVLDLFDWSSKTPGGVSYMAMDSTAARNAALSAQRSSLPTPYDKLVIFEFHFRRKNNHDWKRIDFCHTEISPFAVLVAQAIAYILPRTSPKNRPKRILDTLESPYLIRSESRLVTLFWEVNLWFRQARIPVLWGILGATACHPQQFERLLMNLTKTNGLSEAKPVVLLTGSAIMSPFAETLQKFEIRTLFYQSPQASASLDGTQGDGSALLHRRFPHLQSHAKHLISSPINSTEDGMVRDLPLRFDGRPEALSGGLSIWTSCLSDGTISPSELFRSISKSMTDELRSWAKRALRWVLYSLRPLSLAELASAISLDAPGDTNDPAAVDEAGIFNILDLAIDSLSGILLLSDNVVMLDPTAYESEIALAFGLENERAQLDILESLSKNLRKSAALFQELRPNIYDLPTRTMWGPLANYTMECWPEHYRRSTNNATTRAEAINCLRGLLQRPDTLTFWFWCGQPAMSETDLAALQKQRRESTPTIQTAILATIGVHDLQEIDSLLGGPSWRTDPASVLAAFQQALLWGNEKLPMALEFSTLDPGQIRNVLSAAAAVEADLSANIISHLMLKSREKLNIIDIPPEFLSLPGTITVDDFSEILGEESTTTNFVSKCLGWAVRSSNEAMVSTLVRSGKLSKESLQSSLEENCHTGSPALLQILLRCAEPRFEHVLTACLNGNYPVVAGLLERVSAIQDDDCQKLLDNTDALKALSCAVFQGFTHCTTALLRYIDYNEDANQLQKVIASSIKAGAPLATLELLLRSGVRLGRDEDIPFLVCAVKCKSSEDLVRLLAQCVPSVNEPTDDGETALHVASSTGQLSIVHVLLEEGADVNAMTELGETPLYMASIENKPDVVDALLASGADVCLTTNERRWSPLEAAYDFPDVLRHLLSPKANPRPDVRRVVTSSRDKDTTALWLAVSGGHAESVRLLLQNGDPDLDFANKDYEERTTPLATATRSGLAEIVRLLLEKGADIKCSGDDLVSTSSLLHLVANEDTLAVLLEYNAPLEEIDKNGLTPLGYHIRSGGGDGSIVRRLLNAGANPDCSIQGVTALSFATAVENIELIKLLLRKGAAINRIGPKTRISSSLHLGCRFGRLASVITLVAYGADTSIWAAFEGTPLQIANRASNDVEMLRYLVNEAGVDRTGKASIYRTPFGEACRSGSLEAVSFFLEHKAIVSEMDPIKQPSWYNLGIRACDAMEVFDLVFAAGTDFEAARDILGRSILHVAAFGSHHKLVTRLIELAPGLLSVLDHNGWSPLHWAMRRPLLIGENGRRAYNMPNNEDNRLKVVKRLLEQKRPQLASSVVVAGKEHSIMALARRFAAGPDICKTLSEELGEQCDDHDGDIAEEPLYGRWTCDVCDVQVRGDILICQHELCGGKNFGLCWVCAPYKDEVHDPSHHFERFSPNPPEKPPGVDELKSDI